MKLGLNIVLDYYYFYWNCLRYLFWRHLAAEMSVIALMVVCRSYGILLPFKTMTITCFGLTSIRSTNPITGRWLPTSRFLSPASNKPFPPKFHAPSSSHLSLPIPFSRHCPTLELPGRGIFIIHFSFSPNLDIGFISIDMNSQFLCSFEYTERNMENVRFKIFEPLNLVQICSKSALY